MCITLEWAPQFAVFIKFCVELYITHTLKNSKRGPPLFNITEILQRVYWDDNPTLCKISGLLDHFWWLKIPKNRLLVSDSEPVRLNSQFHGVQAYLKFRRITYFRSTIITMKLCSLYLVGKISLLAFQRDRPCLIPSCMERDMSV